MSYDNAKQFAPMGLVTAATAILANGSAGIIARYFAGFFPIRIKRVGLLVTVAHDTATTVVTLRHRPTPGSASGEVVVDTISIPTTAAVGSIYFVDGLDYRMEPGDELAFDTDGGTTAGVVAAIVEAEVVWEHVDNFPTTLIRSV